MVLEEPYPVRFQYAQKIVRVTPATEAQLSELERGFGALPPDYRQFLATVNGGAPIPGLLDHATYPFEIECFNALGTPQNAYSVQRRSMSASHHLGYPVVAIAGNGAGDQLIIVSGDPIVYQWIHDEDIPPLAVASSFTVLLSSLVSTPQRP